MPTRRHVPEAGDVQREDRADAVLADQVKSVDWVARQAVRKAQVSPDELAQVRQRAAARPGIRCGDQLRRFRCRYWSATTAATMIAPFTISW
jgi:hypothetical protein